MNLKDYTDANTQIALAKLIGFAPSFVNQWVSGRRPVPAIACLAIERATDGAVTRKELRPNDFWKIWPDLTKQPRKAKSAAGTSTTQVGA